jgi:muconolactone delta-isomerase
VTIDDARTLPRARLSSGVEAELRSFDGKMLSLATSRAHAPGERVEVTAATADRTLVVRGKVVRVFRDGEHFAITLSLLALPRVDRAALEALLVPDPTAPATQAKVE